MCPASDAARVTAAGPYGSAGIRSTSLERARGARREPGSPDPALPTLRHTCPSTSSHPRQPHTRRPLMRRRLEPDTVVRIMRRVRKGLENEHRHIMEQDAGRLFDQEALRREASPGLASTGSTEPVFLAITAAESLNPRQPKRGLKGFAVCRGRDQLMDFI